MLGSKTNYMVLKDDVGKPKPNTRRLPSKDFAFGKTEQAEEGANIICTSWKEYPEVDKSVFRK